MKYINLLSVKPQSTLRSLVNAALLSLALLSAGFASAQTTGTGSAINPSANPTIEQAKSALEEAKEALESAQISLNEAQGTTAEPKPTPVKTAANSDGRLYKWVDENGKISYQDSPPPKNVKVINADLLKDKKVGSEQVKELRRANQAKPDNSGTQPVMVYTADNCKPCQSVVLFLTQKQVPFIERDIRTDRRARERLSNLSKQISVPSLFIGERIIQGHSKAMITRALEEAGYLKPQ